MAADNASGGGTLNYSSAVALLAKLLSVVNVEVQADRDSQRVRLQDGKGTRKPVVGCRRLGRAALAVLVVAPLLTVISLSIPGAIRVAGASGDPGGETWHHVTAAGMVDPMALSCAPGTERCVLVGGPSGEGIPGYFPIDGPLADGQVEYSSDGGVTWKVSTSSALGAYGELNGVTCESVTFCLAVGNSSASDTTTWEPGFNIVYLSHDGGATWTPASSIGEPETDTTWSLLNAVSCSSATTCVAVGEYNAPDLGGEIPEYGSVDEILRTTDGGVTWTASSVPRAPTATHHISGASSSLCHVSPEAQTASPSDLPILAPSSPTVTTAELHGRAIRPVPGP